MDYQSSIRMYYHTFSHMVKHWVCSLYLSFYNCVTMLLENNRLKTDLFCKPTDSHNYFLYSSAHSSKCKQRIPYSQYLCIRWICSTLSDYDRHMKMMTLHFLDRGYQIDLQESALKARRLNWYTLLHPPCSSNKATTDRSIIVTTFHPRDDSLRWVVEKNGSILGKSHSMLPVLQQKAPDSL